MQTQQQLEAYFRAQKTSTALASLMPNTNGLLKEEELLTTYAEITFKVADPESDLSEIISKYAPELSEATREQQIAWLQTFRAKIIEDAKNVKIIATAFNETSAGEAINKVKKSDLPPLYLEDLEEQKDPEPIPFDVKNKTLPQIHRELGSQEELKRKLPPALSLSDALELLIKGTRREQTKEQLKIALADLNREPEKRVSELASRYSIPATIEAINRYKAGVEEDLFCNEFLCAAWGTATPEDALNKIYKDKKGRG